MYLWFACEAFTNMKITSIHKNNVWLPDYRGIHNHVFFHWLCQWHQVSRRAPRLCQQTSTSQQCWSASSAEFLRRVSPGGNTGPSCQETAPGNASVTHAFRNNRIISHHYFHCDKTRGTSPNLYVCAGTHLQRMAHYTSTLLRWPTPADTCAWRPIRLGRSRNGWICKYMVGGPVKKIQIFYQY